MRDDHDTAAALSAANTLRQLLSEAELGQREAARLLGIEERTMRQWCAGEGTPPASVFRALSPRLTHIEVMLKRIASNDSVIRAIDAAAITGSGDGPGLSAPGSASQMRAHYVQKNEELLAILRVDQAFDRKQRAIFALSEQASPEGSGVLSDAVMDEAEAAEAEFRAAQLEFERFGREMRNGRR